jgi:parallel beta-helix repeat protein
MSPSLLMLSLVMAAPPASAVVDASKYHDASSPTLGLQAAIDAAGEGGGIVEIPAGRYCLRAGLRLRSHITLRGAGDLTVLTRGSQVRTPLAAPVKVGDRIIPVKSVDGFRVGDEVAVMDKKQRGWYVTHAHVTEIEPGKLHLDIACHKEYDPDREAVVLNYFPFVTATDARGIVVEKLCLDGNLKENPGPESDFTFAAVHFRRVSDSWVRHCTVRGHVSDGIGVQGGADNRVADCLVDGCRGHGFHPGTSLMGSIWQNNIGRNNAWDGLFFCARVRDTVVRGNLFHNNGWSGIGGLGNADDRHNIVSDNICTANGRYGIHATAGRDNVIQGNICRDNSQSEPGRYAGIGLSDTTDTLVSGNRCLDSQQTPTQRPGIVESGACQRNRIVENFVEETAERK